MRRTKWSALALLFSGTLVLAACGPAGESPAATDEPEPDATGTGAPPAEANYADAINMALDAEVGFISNAVTDVPTARITALVYGTLYDVDEAVAPIPQLAADLCEVSEDALTWTCTLREGLTFHNGDPITVDDVVYVYQLAMSENCTFAPASCSSVGPVVESVTATDESTIEFQLFEPYAPFAIYVLGAVYIESQAVIEAAYEEFAGATEGVTSADLTAQAEEIGAAVEAADPAACEGLIEAGTATLTDLGVAVPEQSAFEVDGEFDACTYIGAFQTLLTNAANSLDLEGIDAVAAAYQLLSFNQDPVGSGPYMLESYTPGQGVTLTGFADWFEGAPATPTINMPIFKDVAVAAQALVAGELDWVNDLTPDARAVLEGEESVRLLEFQELGFFALMYQMHESIPLPDGTEWQGWFYDKALRKAVQYCIDKPALVETATDGAGAPIESDIPPASWAFNPDIEAIPRDVDAAVDFIENQATVHTWTRGDDGIYVNQDGDRLSAVVYVRAGQQDRIDFMNLLATQVEECGIEIVVQPQDFQTILIPSLTWPHIAAGQPEPWHAYFGGFGNILDPDPYGFFHSSECSSEETPRTNAYVCFQNPEVDALIEEGLRATDQEARTEIYFEYQELIQEEQPYTFAWANIQADGVDANMAYTDGDLPELTEFWDWQPHKLVILEDGG